MFLLSGDTPWLHEMGSCKDVDLGVVCTLQVYFVLFTLHFLRKVLFTLVSWLFVLDFIVGFKAASLRARRASFSSTLKQREEELRQAKVEQGAPRTAKSEADELIGTLKAKCLVRKQKILVHQDELRINDEALTALRQYFWWSKGWNWSIKERARGRLSKVRKASG